MVPQARLRALTQKKIPAADRRRLLGNDGRVKAAPAAIWERNVRSLARLVPKCRNSNASWASKPSSGENVMKTVSLLAGACALVLLPLGTAAAGPCTTEIENLT